MRARKSPAAGWQVYAASAAMEWAGDRNEKVPVNIFELGLKLFLSLPAYVLAYVDFLVGKIPLFLYAPCIAGVNVSNAI